MKVEVEVQIPDYIEGDEIDMVASRMLRAACREIADSRRSFTPAFYTTIRDEEGTGSTVTVTYNDGR